MPLYGTSLSKENMMSLGISSDIIDLGYRPYGKNIYDFLVGYADDYSLGLNNTDSVTLTFYLPIFRNKFIIYSKDIDSIIYNFSKNYDCICVKSVDLPYEIPEKFLSINKKFLECTYLSHYYVATKVINSLSLSDKLRLLALYVSCMSPKDYIELEGYYENK